MNHEELGNLIREARKRAQLSQSALAESAGVKQSAISQIERGVPNIIAADKLETISQILKIGQLETLSQFGEQNLAVCTNQHCPGLRWKLIHFELVPDPVFFPAKPVLFGAKCSCGEIPIIQCPNPDCRSTISSPSFHCTKCLRPFNMDTEAFEELTPIKAIVQTLRILKETPLLPSAFKHEIDIVGEMISQINQDLEARKPRSEIQLIDNQADPKVIPLSRKTS
ncbi:MAG: helix-turn-helix transcriptional regulator [Verrucomicrobiota bacterium]